MSFRPALILLQCSLGYSFGRNMINVGVLIYPEIQALDLAAAIDCFGQVNQTLMATGRQPFYRLITIGQTTTAVKAENGLQLTAEYTLQDCPAIDYLVLPGGAGARLLAAAVRRQCAKAAVYLYRRLLAGTQWVTGRQGACHPLAFCQGSATALPQSTG